MDNPYKTTRNHRGNPEVNGPGFKHAMIHDTTGEAERTAQIANLAFYHGKAHKARQLRLALYLGK